jgi:hypothetical protein
MSVNRYGSPDVCVAEVGEMTQNEMSALRHVADGLVLFHNGLWGAPAGYRWAAPDGTSAGHVPQWECETLDLLERRRLIAVRQATGARDIPVVATDAGRRLLSTLDNVAA